MIRRGSETRTGGAQPKAVPPWQEFEWEVNELIASLDPGAHLVADEHVLGLISGATRQLDAFVRGQVVGQPITIAVEAKRYKRPISIGTVDEFIGKMLDVGCDRGILCSAGGFSEAALSRASNARHPAVGCVHIQPFTTGGVLQHCRTVPSPAELLKEQLLDRTVGPNRTPEYDEWLSGDVNLYRD